MLSLGKKLFFRQIVLFLFSRDAGLFYTQVIPDYGDPDDSRLWESLKDAAFLIGIYLNE